ncbi:hypothetical protein T12_1176, partial [Trichinella patagoniensis]
MLPTKRELGKRAGRAGSNRTDDTDAEMNLQFDTGVSSFNNDRGSNPVEARNEPAWESGSLHLRRLKPTTSRGQEDQRASKEVTPVFAYPYNPLLIARQPNLCQIVPKNHLPVAVIVGT